MSATFIHPQHPATGSTHDVDGDEASPPEVVAERRPLPWASGRATIVTRKDEDLPVVERAARNPLLADLTLANIGNIVAHLESREEIWNAAAASARDPRDACGWCLAYLAFDLPQGWRPASAAIDCLTPSEAKAWMLPRGHLPDLRRAGIFAASILTARARFRRGAADADEVITAAHYLEELILLKRRLGYAHQCGEEFFALAEFSLVDAPRSSLAYARQAMACLARHGDAALLVEAQALARDARVRVKRQSETSRPRDAPRRAPRELVDVREDDSQLFLVARGTAGDTPLGPFESFGGGVPRTGLQQLMDPTLEARRAGKYVIWRADGGRWIGDEIDDPVGMVLCTLSDAAQLARLHPDCINHMRTTISESVATLEAFANLVVDFLTLDGPEIWPDPGLKGMFQNPEAFKNKTSLLPKLKCIGDGMFNNTPASSDGAPWLSKAICDDLACLIVRRNANTHLKVTGRKRLAPSRPTRGARNVGRPVQAWSEWAGQSAAVVQATIAAFRTAFASAHGVPPRDPEEMPPGFPNSEWLALDVGDGRMVKIPGMSRSAAPHG